MAAQTSSSTVSTITIVPQSVRSGLIGSAWRFVAVDEHQRIVAASASFECSGHAPRNSKQAHIALESIVAELRHGGWIMTNRPDRFGNTSWYAYAFQYGGVPPAPPEERPTEPRPAYIVIRTEQTRTGLVMPHFRFVAVDRHGTVIASSEEFDSGMRSVLDGKTERRVLESLLTKLRLDGWVLDLTPDQQPHSEWYTYGFRSPNVGGSASSGPLLASASRRGGMSIQAMWGITLAVVILLFAICVVLAFTAQLEIRPAG